MKLYTGTPYISLAFKTFYLPQSLLEPSSSPFDLEGKKQVDICKTYSAHQRFQLLHKNWYGHYYYDNKIVFPDLNRVFF